MYVEIDNIGGQKENRELLNICMFRVAFSHVSECFDCCPCIAAVLEGAFCRSYFGKVPAVDGFF